MGRLIVTYPPIEGEVHFGHKAKIQGQERGWESGRFSLPHLYKNTHLYTQDKRQNHMHFVTKTQKKTHWLEEPSQLGIKQSSRMCMTQHRVETSTYIQIVFLEFPSFQTEPEFLQEPY